MPKGKGYGRKGSSSRRSNSKGRPIRKTMRPNKKAGKKIFYVGGYQA